MLETYTVIAYGMGKAFIHILKDWIPIQIFYTLRTAAINMLAGECMEMRGYV